MPFPFPTPSEAATARVNPGFVSTIGSNFLHRAPYIGPLYNAGSTIAHLIQGTAGQYGPATSPIGRLLQLFSSNPSGSPQPYSVSTTALNNLQGNPGYPSALPALGGPQLPTNSETNNPPMYGNDQPVVAPSGLGPGGIPNSVWQQVYNTGRFTNAPAFSPTLAQAEFPGSRIGPGGTSVANPYDPNSTHGTPNTVVTSIPADAAAFMAEIRARNIQ